MPSPDPSLICMQRPATSWLSRLWAFTALLCTVAILNASFASAQSSLFIMEHQAKGDVKLADGGWISTCDGSQASCVGHIDAPDVHDAADMMDLNHHHHFNENPSGTLNDMDVAVPFPAVASVTLRPDVTKNLAGQFPASIDQPPRGLSRI
ncbi:hypothetical protein MMA231_03533 (plasmid) [Asticcacaulis sp. MM231]|uniref:hypothetical protein n=1 Tax=Asticcacaulis sp. MM231 TaxID=3157666 RepID=UPI0032D58A37